MCVPIITHENARRCLSSAALHHINEKRPQTRKFETRIDVFLSDVKREVTETAETPDRHEKQKRGAKREVFAEQHARRDKARPQKQSALEED